MSSRASRVELVRRLAEARRDGDRRRVREVREELARLETGRVETPEAS